MKALLVGASPEGLGPRALRELRLAATQADWIVAVDGGLALLKRAKVTPHVYVGDLDSLGKTRLPHTLPAILLPPRKDYSDLACALETACNLGASQIEAWGVLGGRHDHHEASLAELGLISERARVRAVTFERVGEPGGGRVEAHLVRPGKPLTLTNVARGARVSIFAANGPARGVSARGLEWELLNQGLPRSSRGLSNRAKASRITVSLKSGLLLVWLASKTN